MKWIAVLFTTLLLITTSQTCTPIPGCDVTINGNCYAHVDHSLDWNEAEDCCMEWGGHLASIHSGGINSVLNDIRNQDRYTWIGLSDTDRNGVYVWTDRTPYNYENFAPNEPNGGQGGESCFHFFTRTKGPLSWNDNECDESTHGRYRTSYICQKEYVIPTLKGEPGEPGTAGSNGLIGVPGSNGLNGVPGTNGLNGQPGTNGGKGDPGTNGGKGDPGTDGGKGDPGTNGGKGERGIYGPTGQQGRGGDTGAPGRKGVDGQPGTDGLKGEHGGKGERGKRGKRGFPGV